MLAFEVLCMVGFFPSLTYILLWKLQMVQSFENENMISENTCEVFMNDGMEKEYEINLNLQIESNHNPKNEKKYCMLEK